MDTVQDPTLHPVPVHLQNLHAAAAFHHPLTSQLGPEYTHPNFHHNGINHVQSYSPFDPALQMPVRHSSGPYDEGQPMQARRRRRRQQQQQQQQQHLSFRDDQDETPSKDKGGHFGRMKTIPNPPNLKKWREKLFDVDEIITLTEEEFQTYFPHVDNIYSHRSTQKYKRKPFVSQYWDCRLKGRPSGTAKTDDPSKKKRRRTARQRDLCDVKIKITEYFPGASPNNDVGAMDQADLDGAAGDSTLDLMDHDHDPAPQPFGVLAPNLTLPAGHPGAGGARYYTIQRVNGGANGKENDGGRHKHTLEESDAIKKNSIQRQMLKEERELKKKEAAVHKTTSNAVPTTPSQPIDNSDNGNNDDDNHHIHNPLPEPEPIHPSPQSQSQSQSQSQPQAPNPSKSLPPPPPTTPKTQVQFHNRRSSPSAQRIWIALEVTGVAYDYVEGPDKHDQDAEQDRGSEGDEAEEECGARYGGYIRHGEFVVRGSRVVVEYLDDLALGVTHHRPLLLLPSTLDEPQLRAHCRMWTDHIDRKVIPALNKVVITTSGASKSDSSSTDPQFSSVDLATTTSSAAAANALRRSLEPLITACHPTGPFFLGPDISFVDVMLAPWIVRFWPVLARVFHSLEVGGECEQGEQGRRLRRGRWQRWMEAVEGCEGVRRTVCQGSGGVGLGF